MAGPSDDEGPLLAHVARPDVVLLLQGGLDLLANRRLVLLEDLDDLLKHPLGLLDDLRLLPHAAGDLVHVLLEVGRHLGLRDLLRVDLEGPDQGLPAPRRADHLAFHVLPVVQLLDDLVAGGLRPEAELLHLLDQVPLGVPRDGLRAVLLDPDVRERNRLPDLEGGHRGLPHGPVRVVLPPARVLHDVPVRAELLPARVELRLGHVDDARRRDRREEPPGDELVDPPVVLPPDVRLLRPRGRVDRRVVRRLHGTATGPDLLLGEELLRFFGEVRVLELVQDPPQAQGRRVHRVVRPRVAEPPALVQALRDPHRLRGAVPEAVRLREEARRGERGGGPLLPLVPRVLEDGSRLRGEGVPLGGLRLVLRPEPALLVGRGELGARLVERGGDAPEVLRDEVLDLPLPVHDQREGRALDPAHGEEVLPHPLRGDGDEAGQGGAPREVDDLAGLRGLREGEVEVHEVREGLLDLRPSQRGVPGPPDRDVRVHRPDHLEGLLADQFALAVEVRRDDHLVDAPGELRERIRERRLRDLLHGLDPDEPLQVRVPPVVELVGVVEVQDVPPHPDDGDVVAVLRERERRHAADLRPLHFPCGENRGDADGGVQFLTDNQLSHGLRTISSRYLTVCR